MGEDCGRYEKQGDTYFETADPRDCDMIFIETLMITTEVGCYEADRVKINDMCHSWLTRVQCERASSCYFIVPVPTD